MSKLYLYLISHSNEKELYPLTLKEKCKASLILNYNLIPINKFTDNDNIPQEGDRIILLSKINKTFYDNYGNEKRLYGLLCDFVLSREIFGPSSSQILSPTLPLEFMLTSQYYSHLFMLTNVRYFNQSKLIDTNDLKNILGVNIIRNLDTQPQAIKNTDLLVNKLYKYASFVTNISEVSNNSIKTYLNFKNAIRSHYYIVKEKNNKFSNNKIQKHNIKLEKSTYAKTVLERAEDAAINNKDYIPYRRKIVASRNDEKNDKVLFNFLFENEVKDMDSFFYYIGSDLFLKKLFPVSQYPRNQFLIIPLLSNVYFESEKIRNLKSNITLDFFDEKENLTGSSSGRPDGIYVLFDKKNKSFDIYILELKKHYSEKGDITDFEALQQKVKSQKATIEPDDTDDETTDNNKEYWLMYEQFAFNNGSQGIYEDSHIKQADLFFSRLDGTSCYYNLNSTKHSVTLKNSISNEVESLSQAQIELLKKNSIIKLSSIITYLMLGEKNGAKYKNQDYYKTLYKNSEPIEATIFKGISSALKSNLKYVFIIDKISDEHANKMIKTIQYHNATPMLFLINRFIIANKKNKQSEIKTTFKNIP